MKLLPLTIVLAMALTACQKEDPVEDVVSSGPCGSDGARIQATFGGNDWCANANVQAAGSDNSAIVSGVSLNGGSLVINIDSIGIGAQPITEALNGVLYSAVEGSYTVPQDGHGTLTITNYDPTSARLKGTADIGLRLNGDGAAKHLIASFDVTLGGE